MIDASNISSGVCNKDIPKNVNVTRVPPINNNTSCAYVKGKQNDGMGL